MADVKIRIIGEDQASRTLQGIDQQLSSFVGTAAKVSGAVAVVGVTMKKAFDLGAEGAAILQTAESFDMLLEKVGAAPDLLDQLRAASKGTIPDMQLMSSTATLLAGATGKLATDMAMAAPEILNIAKAANKLNPTLGDTEFLYQSLMTGIKRGSPMLIDNTGLTLKLGEANEKYAASLGKSAEELDANEQKQAILQATLEAGNALLEQVGGNTDSQTDAFARLDTATENLANKLKTMLVPYLTDAAEALLVLLDGANQVNAALAANIPEVAKGAKSWDDYSQAVKRMLEAAGYSVKVTEDQITVWQKNGRMVAEATERWGAMTKAQWIAAQAADEHTQKIENVSKALRDVGKASADANPNIIAGAEANKWGAMYAGLATEKTITYSQAVTQLKEAESERLQELYKLRDAERERLAQQLTEVSVAGRLQSIFESYTDTVDRAKRSNAELVMEYRELISSGKGTEEQFRRIRDAISENNQTQREAIETMKKQTAEMIYQQAAQGLTSEAALVLARGLGLVSEQDYKLITQLQALKAQFDANGDGMISAAEGAAEYTERVIELYNATVKAKEGLIQMQAALKMPAGGGGGAGGMQVGAGMVEIAPGVYQYTAPGETTTMSNPAAGIYTGGAGETIGPGSAAVNYTYNNYGVNLQDQAELQRILTPIIMNIINGR